MDGTVRQLEDGYELRFERHFPHSIDKVWAALTEPERFKDWLSEGGEIELRVGGRVYLAGDEIDSTVTELDPPRVIAYGWKGAEWDGGVVRWQLDAAGDGTKVVLTHEIPPMSPGEADEFRERLGLPEGWHPQSSTLAGWHLILGRLGDALDGTPSEFPMDQWKVLNERYKQRIVAGSA